MEQMLVRWCESVWFYLSCGNANSSGKVRKLRWHRLNDRGTLEKGTQDTYLIVPLGQLPITEGCHCELRRVWTYPNT